jgi:hypothetical protein
MESIHVFMTGIAVILLLLFSIFLYDREVRNGIIMTDLREEFESLSLAIRSCTPADGEALILKFEDKWSKYVDPVTLSNYTYELYKIIFSKHGRAALN